jgi:RHS repeat-associated protein
MSTNSKSLNPHYPPLSRRTSLTRPNAVNTAYGYDNLSRLLSVTHANGGVTLDGASYGLDNAGNRTSKSDLHAGVTTNYGYDNIYELLSATQGASTTESYTYDPVGNRLGNLSGSGWSNNTSNELTSRPGVAYTYDNNGNTLTKADSTGTTNYSWDFENRLTSVTLPGSGGTVSFAYDPFGRRIKKASSAGTSIYAYDGDNLAEEANAAGAAVARYSQGLNIDEPLAMLRSSTTSYYQADGLGSVTSLTNAAGTAAQNYTYDSFGNIIATTGSLVNSFRYTGREWDTETNLYYYRARYYDPNIGRFISEDPIHFKSGINFYSYVSNSPTGFVDPSGLSPADVAKLQKFLRGVIDQMTKDGVRRDPGKLNNILSTLGYPWGRPYLGCADQTKVVNDAYDSNFPSFHLDNGWSFQTHTSLGGAHTYGVLQSANPSDPDIQVDPLNGIVKAVPKGTK